MNAEYEQIHEAVRLDPESVWERLSAYLCTSATGSSATEEYLDRVDLIEDLMFWHADAFIDRIQALAETCPDLQDDVAAAYVGGLAGSPGRSPPRSRSRRAPRGPWPR